MEKQSRSHRNPSAVSTGTKDSSASKLSIGVSHTVDPAAPATQDGILITPSSETDEDAVVIKDVGLKHKNNSQRSVDRKKQWKDNEPTWFTEAYRCMQDNQQEWREQLQSHTDKQEQLQSECTAVMKQTNELLKSLVEACKKKIEKQSCYHYRNASVFTVLFYCDFLFVVSVNHIQFSRLHAISDAVIIRSP